MYATRSPASIPDARNARARRVASRGEIAIGRAAITVDDRHLAGEHLGGTLQETQRRQLAVRQRGHGGDSSPLVAVTLRLSRPAYGRNTPGDICGFPPSRMWVTADVCPVARAQGCGNDPSCRDCRRRRWRARRSPGAPRPRGRSRPYQRAHSRPSLDLPRVVGRRAVRERARPALRLGAHRPRPRSALDSGSPRSRPSRALARWTQGTVRRFPTTRCSWPSAPSPSRRWRGPSVSPGRATSWPSGRRSRH